MDDVILRDVVTNLAILPAGGTPAQPHDLLASGRFRQMVRETMREYDLTRYATSPANQSADGITVAHSAGCAQIVRRRARRYRRDERTPAHRLNDSGSGVLGAVLKDRQSGGWRQ